MGMNTILPGSSSIRKRKEDHESLFSTIHRARVTEVHVNKGTINIILEKVSYSTEVTIPLLGLSTPPSVDDPTQADFKASSWGRYIPQVGDMILVGFGSDGTLYALGYSAVFYKGMELEDESQENTGGINWGETSGKRMKPGDWDFKSSRNSNLYIGDRVKVSSGINSVTVNGPSSDVNITSPLSIQRATVSESRFGAARRFVLPTDEEESYIPTTRGGIPDYAQEASWKVKWNNATPSGGDLAEFSFGDVIEDLPAVGSLIRLSDFGQPIRRYFVASDTTGLLTVFEESIDTLGNFSVGSTTSTSFKWDTILAAWDISNLSTSISSTANIDISATAKITISGIAGVDIIGTAPVILDSDSLIQFGGSSASQPFIKGSDWLSFMTSLITLLISHTHPTAMGLSSPSVDIVAQGPGLITQAGRTLSSLVMGS